MSAPHKCMQYYWYHCPWIFVTGTVKRDQVGTKYAISHNGKYLELGIQYLLSVSCKTLSIKLLIDGENFTSMALADH